MEKRANVTERVADYIRVNIANGSWPLDSKIPSENEMCQALGVSRMSVRSALQQFIALDILESQHGRGTFVRSTDLSPFRYGLGVVDTSDKKYMDNLQLRELLEPQVVYRVTPHAGEELIARLRQLSRAMKDSVGDRQTFVQNDMQFHQCLADALNNPSLTALMHGILEQTAHYNIHNEQMGYYGGLYYHALIAEAVARHDAVAARDLMEEHLHLNSYGADGKAPA